MSGFQNSGLKIVAAKTECWKNICGHASQTNDDKHEFQGKSWCPAEIWKEGVLNCMATHIQRLSRDLFLPPVHLDSHHTQRGLNRLVSINFHLYILLVTCKVCKAFPSSEWNFPHLGFFPVWLLFVILEIGACVLERGREKRTVHSVTILAKHLACVVENNRRLLSEYLGKN